MLEFLGLIFLYKWLTTHDSKPKTCSINATEAMNNLTGRWLLDDDGVLDKDERKIKCINVIGP